MKQQTAIEWLVDQLKEFAFIPEHHIGMRDIRITQGYLDELAEQAKQMEKEQHGTTWDKAIDAHERRGHVIARSWCDFDDYYNETYGK